MAAGESLGWPVGRSMAGWMGRSAGCTHRSTKWLTDRRTDRPASWLHVNNEPTPIHPSICLSVWLSACLSVCLSIRHRRGRKSLRLRHPGTADGYRPLSPPHHECPRICRRCLRCPWGRPHLPDHLPPLHSPSPCPPTPTPPACTPAAARGPHPHPHCPHAHSATGCGESGSYAPTRHYWRPASHDLECSRAVPAPTNQWQQQRGAPHCRAWVVGEGGRVGARTVRV
mmetsp:Transcript_51222/g.128655  ORF Transcript_51222/g.128655 Transcript_51222/m.128655 type:complete len:227 (-) Transcript_51222:106-786(-)